MNGSMSRVAAGWGILPLRLVLGLVFALHGGQKLFVYGVGATSAAMMHMGIPLPSVAGPVAIIAEFLGGLAILLGLYARWPAVLMAIEMAIVVFVVKRGGGFFAPGGYEFELTLLAGALTIAALGTGPWSLDAVFRRRPTA